MQASVAGVRADVLAGWRVGGRLAVWLAGCLAGWLPGWPPGRLAGWPAGSHSFHVSLKASLPCLLLPSTFWASALLSVSISHSFHTTGPYQPNHHHRFLCKTFLHSNLHSQFVHSSLISLSTPTSRLTYLFFIIISSNITCCEVTVSMQMPHHSC